MMISDAMVNKGIVVYTGYKSDAKWPSEKMEKVRELFDPAVAEEVIKRVDAIIDDLNELRPDWDEMESPASQDLAKKIMRKVRPEYTKEINNSTPLSALALVAASNWAREEMEKKYPFLDNDALEALKWLFSWWWFK